MFMVRAPRLGVIAVASGRVLVKSACWDSVAAVWADDKYPVASVVAEFHGHVVREAVAELGEFAIGTGWDLWAEAKFFAGCVGAELRHGRLLVSDH